VTNRTPKQLYNDQISHSSSRGINWELSYEQWIEMWLVSGQWENRGKEKGQYQMCRFYDEGPYSCTNCYIGTVEENQKDRHKIPDGETGDIISMWISGRFTQSEIGISFGMSQSAISKIINGKRRSHEVYT